MRASPSRRNNYRFRTDSCQNQLKDKFRNDVEIVVNNNQDKITDKYDRKNKLNYILSATIEKLKIGNLVLNYTKYVSTYGKQTLFALQRSEIKRHRNAQAMTKNHGPIKHVRVVPKDPSEKDNKPEFRPLDDLINSKFGRG